MMKNNAIVEQIAKLLDDYNLKEQSEILANVLRLFDYTVPANMVKHNVEGLVKSQLPWYSEGNEDAGFMDLTAILSEFEEMVSADDSEWEGKIKFTHAVKYAETPEEKEEHGIDPDSGIEWLVPDKSVDIKKIMIQFEINE